MMAGAGWRLSTPKVFVIVLNWNGWKDTIECFESLTQIRYPNYGVIVVDNGSTAQDRDALRRWRDRVTLIEQETNRGFAGGNNIGIRHALRDPATEYVLILNNDTVVDPRFLDEMVETALSRNVDMVSPTVLTHADRATIDRLGIVISAALLGYDMKRWEGREPLCPSGCCALYSRQLLEAVQVEGEYFDEDFFAYAEDVDLGIRAVLRGYRAALAPRAIVYHKGSASTFVQSPFSQYHGHRNTLWYLAKSVPASVLMRHIHWVVAGQLLPLLPNAARGRLGLLLRAKIDGLRGIPRMLRKRRAVLRGDVNEDLLGSLLDRRPFYLFPPKRPSRLARLLRTLLWGDRPG